MSRSLLALVSVLVAAVLALALGPGESSANQAAATAAPLNLTFRYAGMPATGSSQVRFVDGVQGIGTQTAAALNTQGTIRAFFAYQQGFTITSAEFGSLNATVNAVVQPSTGVSAIDGTATTPAGTTLTVQVNGGDAVPITSRFSIPVPSLAATRKPQRPAKPQCRKRRPGAR